MPAADKDRALVTATEAKNKFGLLLEKAMQGGVVVITKHDAPKAVLISMDEYTALASAPESRIDTLSAEFDSGRFPRFAKAAGKGRSGGCAEAWLSLLEFPASMCSREPTAPGKAVLWGRCCSNKEWSILTPITLHSASCPLILVSHSWKPTAQPGMKASDCSNVPSPKNSILPSRPRSGERPLPIFSTKRSRNELKSGFGTWAWTAWSAT